MKLDTSKIKDGVAIHCPKKEYVRPLFEAMGWKGIDVGERQWEEYKERLCFRLDGTGWVYCEIEYYQTHGYTIIPFTDLIIEENKKSRLAEILGVEEDEQFMWGDFNDVYRIHNGVRQKKDNGKWALCVNEFHLSLMINHPEKIKPLPKWTPEEQEMAKTIISIYGSGSKLRRLENGFLLLVGDGEILIIPEHFPSLQPGECVSLKEIAGGGE